MMSRFAALPHNETESSTFQWKKISLQCTKEGGATCLHQGGGDTKHKSNKADREKRVHRRGWGPVFGALLGWVVGAPTCYHHDKSLCATSCPPKLAQLLFLLPRSPVLQNQCPITFCFLALSTRHISVFFSSLCDVMTQEEEKDKRKEELQARRL